MSFHPYHSNIAQQSIQHFPPGSYPATTPNAHSFVGPGFSSLSNPAASQNIHAFVGAYPNTLMNGSWTSYPPMSSFGPSPLVFQASNAAPHSGNLFSQSNRRNPCATPSHHDEKPALTPQNSSAVFSRLISKELGRYRAINSRVPATRMPPFDRTTYAGFSSPSPNPEGFFRPRTNGNVNWPVQNMDCQSNGPRLFGPAPFYQSPHHLVRLPFVQPQKVGKPLPVTRMHQLKHPSHLQYQPQHPTGQPTANIVFGDVNSLIEQVSLRTIGRSKLGQACTLG